MFSKADLQWLSKATAGKADTRTMLTWGWTNAMRDGSRAMVTCDGYHAHLIWEGDERFPVSLAFKDSQPSSHKYPDIETAMPKSVDCGFTVYSPDLIQACKVARAFSSFVVFKILPWENLLKVCAVSAEHGDVETLVGIDMQTPEYHARTIEATYNVKYVLDALSGFGKKEHVLFQSPAGHGALQIGQYGKRMALVMPLTGEGPKNHFKAKAPAPAPTPTPNPEPVNPFTRPTPKPAVPVWLRGAKKATAWIDEDPEVIKVADDLVIAVL